jgi:hypothetical protein
MSERQSPTALAYAPTRRQAIAGVSVAFAGLVLGSIEVWTQTAEEISCTAESIQAETWKIILDLLGCSAGAPRVNSCTTESSVTRELPMRIEPSSQSVNGTVCVVSRGDNSLIIHKGR